MRFRSPCCVVVPTNGTVIPVTIQRGTARNSLVGVVCDRGPDVGTRWTSFSLLAFIFGLCWGGDLVHCVYVGYEHKARNCFGHPVLCRPFCSGDRGESPCPLVLHAFVGFLYFIMPAAFILAHEQGACRGGHGFPQREAYSPTGLHCGTHDQEARMSL